MSMIRNILILKGNKQDVEEFIKNFMSKGFEAYIPTPYVLREYNTETPIHHMIVESIIKQESFTVYNSQEIKNQLLNAIKDIIENKSYNTIVKKELKEIYKCLQTGYFSWQDFHLTHWGVKINATNIEQIDINILSFNTIWSIPEKFFRNVVEFLPLSFELLSYDENNVLISKLHIEKKSKNE